jgi:hypothetical protein
VALPLLRNTSAAVTLYLFTSLCLEVASLAASLLSGMPVLPQFNKPWLASSLRWVPASLSLCLAVNVSTA